MLTAAEVSVSYYRERGWKRIDNARDLLTDVEDYLASWGLSRSTISRLDIADGVVRLQAEGVEQLASVEQAAFETSVREGTTAPSDADLAGRINAMSTEEFGAYRAQLGLR